LLTVVTQRTDSCAFSEAERIVFAAEGLFLAHDFPFYCGIRVQVVQLQPEANGETSKTDFELACGPGQRST
jgi:hypothetical protein